jgi:hypothetical protein
MSKQTYYLRNAVSTEAEQFTDEQSPIDGVERMRFGAQEAWGVRTNDPARPLQRIAVGDFVLYEGDGTRRVVEQAIFPRVYVAADKSLIPVGVESLAKLVFKPEAGDCLVVNFPHPIPETAARHLREQLSEFYPGAKILILVGEMKLGVLRVEK